MTKRMSFEGERWDNVKCAEPGHADRTIGLIGCGSFAYSVIAYYLARKHTKRFLRGAYDLDPARACSLTRAYGGAYAARDAQELLDDPQIKLIYIASNHASHADYAVQALDCGKHVHIEKPHVVDAGQLDRLVAAKRRNPGGLIFLGFNRPRSEHFRRIAAALATQSGPAMINWFIAGHEIPEDHWYFSEEEGGRILGNLCHWTDLTLEMVGRENAFPCEIVPCSAGDARSDFATSLLFADKSVAVISFSAKGHAFEGVREVLHAHRGNVLVELKDFKRSTVDVIHKRTRYVSARRDHGHAANILNSARGACRNAPCHAPDLGHMVDTARLFLAVREAHKSRRVVLVGSSGELGGCLLEGVLPQALGT